MRRPERVQRKNRTVWQLRFEDQFRRIRYRTFRTKAEAERFARETETAQSLGVDPARRVRFNELIQEWDQSHLAHGLRPSSVKDYKQSLKRLSAFFGQREVRGISAVDLERCRNALVLAVQVERTAQFERVLANARRKKDKTPLERYAQIRRELTLIERESEVRANIARGGIRAAAKMIGCARTLWKFAVSRGYAARNIAQDVKKPVALGVVETDLIDTNILAPAEIERLITHTPAEHRCAMRFLFMAGVRFGELTGLMWTDMDWASSRVIVRRQRSGITGKLTAPKTKAGTRWIDLPADLIKELKAHRLQNPGEFMFPIDERNWRSRVWHPSLRRAGLRSVRIHDARHTHASLLIGSGADIVAVSRRLGHANPAITLTVYSHAFARRDTAPLGEKLAAFIRQETVGCDSVATAPDAAQTDTKVIDLMVARGGIEPPTRGFSVRCSTN
jgi:integrase